MSIRSNSGSKSERLFSPGIDDARVDQFWRDGYLIERAVFTPEEVECWRHRALEIGATAADLMSDDILRDIVLDPRLISRAAAILGKQPVYFGDSVAAIGGAGLGGFHKDCSDRYDGNAPDWQVDRYPTIRFGIYTQLHAGMPGGLDLRRGSHNHPDITSGQWDSADTRPGDLVVWNGRTTHSGPSAVLRGGLRIKPNGILWRLLTRLPSERFLVRHPVERVALFVTYGAGDPLLERHIDYLRTRTYAVEGWKASSWSEDSEVVANSRGLKLVTSEERLANIGPTYEEYRQLPYWFAAAKMAQNA